MEIRGMAKMIIARIGEAVRFEWEGKQLEGVIFLTEPQHKLGLKKCLIDADGERYLIPQWMLIAK
jgi:hypothetical protein